jgi:hypothetical protein
MLVSLTFFVNILQNIATFSEMLDFFYIFHLQRSAHNNRGDTRRSGASLGSGGGGGGGERGGEIRLSAWDQEL